MGGATDCSRQDGPAKTGGAAEQAVLALLRAGNPSGAIAQIKVAPSVRDLNAQEKALVAAKLAGRWRDVDLAITENLQALSAPRLHRSP